MHARPWPLAQRTTPRKGWRLRLAATARATRQVRRPKKAQRPARVPPRPAPAAAPPPVPAARYWACEMTTGEHCPRRHCDAALARSWHAEASARAAAARRTTPLPRAASGMERHQTTTRERLSGAAWRAAAANPRGLNRTAWSSSCGAVQQARAWCTPDARGSYTAYSRRNRAAANRADAGCRVLSLSLGLQVRSARAFGGRPAASCARRVGVNLADRSGGHSRCPVASHPNLSQAPRSTARASERGRSGQGGSGCQTCLAGSSRHAC
mmetsp:Transcript_14580/g.42640  ORF Transcript_14580/g.42640 Transcript_14580/m.42640 type:complete len:268 (-) Transcript_14580:72-875(-)